MISQKEVNLPLCEKMDDVQDTLCENSKNSGGSMNMDEFLNSIWTAEHDQVQPQSTNFMPAANVDINAKKSSNTTQAQQRRQLTFGEMTLEDFLVRAGVGFEPSQTRTPQIPIQQQPCQRMPQPAVGEMLSTYPKAIHGGGGPSSMPLCFVDTIGNASGASYGQQVQPLTSPVSSGGLCDQLGNMGGGGGGRKGPIERVVDRRRRRMIKNRESAARSRARKHAYTIELEAELKQVKEDNAHLKQVLTEMETKRKQQEMVEMKVKSVADCQCCKDLPLSHSDKTSYLMAILTAEITLNLLARQHGDIRSSTFDVIV